MNCMLGQTRNLRHLYIKSGVMGINVINRLVPTSVPQIYVVLVPLNLYT